MVHSQRFKDFLQLCFAFQQRFSFFKIQFNQSRFFIFQDSIRSISIQEIEIMIDDIHEVACQI